MVRIPDARMTDTSYGTVAPHIAPEAATGGPLVLVENGHPIRLDAEGRRMDLMIPEAELEWQKSCCKPQERNYDRRYARLYLDTVLQADEGCEVSFLRKTDGAPRKLALAS